MAITAVGESQSFSYTGAVEEFIVPFTGLYRLEVYGAGGGASSKVATVGGNGGSSVGYALLKKGDILYIGCGGGGSANGGFTFNGGGSGAYQSKNNGSGGGATHIAKGTNRGALKNYVDYKSEILIVAGGGGGAGVNDTYVCHGGAGGGASGLAGTGAPSGGNGGGGTQTEAGSNGYDVNMGDVHGGFGYGGYTTKDGYLGGGGGGGWYGGGAGGNYNGYTGGGGGSGYISGVPAITVKDQTYSPSTTTGGGGARGYYAYDANVGYVQRVGENGKAIITFIAKTASFGWFGDKEIVNLRLGDKEISGWKVE